MSACVETSSTTKPEDSTYSHSRKNMAADISSNSWPANYSQDCDLERDFDSMLRRCLAEKLQQNSETDMTEVDDLNASTEWVIFGEDEIKESNEREAQMKMESSAEMENCPVKKSSEIPDPVTTTTPESTTVDNQPSLEQKVKIDQEEKCLVKKSGEVPDPETTTTPESTTVDNQPSLEQKMKIDQEEKCLVKKSGEVPDPETTTTPESPTVDDQPSLEQKMMEKIGGHRPKKSNKVKKSKKIQGINKKFKAANSDLFGFDYSLSFWRSPDHEENTEEMEVELKKFQELCTSSSDEPCEGFTENNTQTVTQTVKDTNTPTYEELLDREEYVFYQHLYTNTDKTDMLTYMDMKLSKNDYDLIHRFCGKTKGKQERIRAHKKKWHTRKAGRQLKTKYCRTVINSAHGEKHFVHHRVAKHMLMAIDIRSRYQRGIPSMKDIDKRWMAAWGNASQPNNVKRAAGVVNPPGGNNRPIWTPSKRKPRSTHHTINAYNADHAFEADLVNILINLQDRDLTPEDYEILLRLDERVQRKTVDKPVIDSLKEDTVSSDLVGEVCAICMDEYASGDLRKHLPCGHYFHKDCLVQWLSNSVTCPLDGIDVQS